MNVDVDRQQRLRLTLLHPTKKKKGGMNEVERDPDARSKGGKL